MHQQEVTEWMEQIHTYIYIYISMLIVVDPVC